jgi:hypothetical protein
MIERTGQFSVTRDEDGFPVAIEPVHATLAASAQPAKESFGATVVNPSEPRRDR